MTDRRVFLELAKIAKQRGTLTKTLLRVYLKNMVIAYKKEKAADATAAQIKDTSKVSIVIIPQRKVEWYEKIG
ncbi:hypothetical protein [Paenibacillus ottowii]|uniref:Uncharacterized protein n=1 Tax=Paenibacillus ottowii TaxID=2315729 RepID=A0ABY3B3C7_9BACL|nr:hypothetical protein [Paenibacillus ottowii]TQR97353.1 hypothetical protein FKV70_19160 [Paenibacillus ottowii]